MSLPAITLALLLPALPLDLTEAAQASVRPRECAGSATVWEKVREPRLREYCDSLARGFGKLATTPNEALALANRASELAPHRAAPLVLLGRAEVALGRYEEGRAALERARAKDDRALEEPGAMHAHAKSLAQTGALEEARAVYRALASRVSLLEGAELRVRALLEGADLLMTPDSLDEAVALLRRARKEPLRESRARVAASLSLALDRMGASEEAAALMREARAAGGRAAVLAFSSEALSTGEGEALLAWVSEATSPAEAKKHWEAYLAASPRLFAEHARTRLAALRAPERRPASMR